MITPREQQSAWGSNPLRTVVSARPIMRAFDAKVHSSWLQGLWTRAMHPRWCMSEGVLEAVLSSTKLVLVAEQNGIPLGVGAVDYDSFGEAGLLFLLVDPAWQRQGVGTSLLRALEAQLRAVQISVLRLGAVSTATYLWPGMPEETEGAWPFFANRGWVREEGCADLVQELGNFQTPGWLVKSLEAAGVVLTLSNPALRSRVVAFEAETFPAWANYFTQEPDTPSSDAEMLVALGADGQVVGTLLLNADIPPRWSSDANVPVGSVNTLGVAPDRRQQGIGLALAAKAMEVLQERGCAKCYVQWTGLAAWYGKLGTSVWARYRMAGKVL